MKPWRVFSAAALAAIGLASGPAFAASGDAASRIPYEIITDTYRNSDYVLLELGTVATAAEICEVMGHPFFDANYDIFREAIDTISGSIDDNGLASKWIVERLNGQELFGRSFTPTESVLSSIERNMSQCLRTIYETDPDKYELIRTTFLRYIPEGDICGVPKTSNEERILDDGSRVTVQVPGTFQPCVDFGYDGRTYQYDALGTTIGLVMLSLREAHPVLRSILDDSNDKIVAWEFAQRQAQQQVETAAAEAERQRQLRTIAENEAFAAADAELRARGIQGISVFGLHWGMSYSGMIGALESGGYTCGLAETLFGNTFSCRVGQKEIIADRSSFSFNCHVYNGCKYTFVEIAQSIVDNGVVRSLEPMEREYGALFGASYYVDRYCGRGENGDMLCVAERQFDGLAPEITVVLSRGALGDQGLTFN